MPSEFKGLRYFEGRISPERELALLQFIQAQQAWSQVSQKEGRRVLHFGFKYDYRHRTVVRNDTVRPIPPELVELAALIPPPDPAAGDIPAAFVQDWNQCIINEYEPGQGITWYTDAKVF